MKFQYKQAGKLQQKSQTKVCKHANWCNLRYYNVSRYENPQRESKMDSPSCEGIHAQLQKQERQSKTKTNQKRNTHKVSKRLIH